MFGERKVINQFQKVNDAILLPRAQEDYVSQKTSRPVFRRVMLLAASFAIVISTVAIFAVWQKENTRTPIEQPGIADTQVTQSQAPTQKQTMPPSMSGTQVKQEVFYAKLYLSAPSASGGWQWEYHLTPDEPGRLGYIRAVNGDKSFTYISIDELIEGKPADDGFFHFYRNDEVVSGIKQMEGTSYIGFKKQDFKKPEQMDLYIERDGKWYMILIRHPIQSFEGEDGLKKYEQAIRDLGLTVEEYVDFNNRFMTENGLQEVIK